MFLRLGSYIADTYPEYEVYYVNYPNKELESLYSSSKLKIIDIRSYDPTMFNDACFVVPYNYVMELLIRFGNVKRSNVIFFYYHQEIMEWLNNQMRSPIINTHEFLELIYKKNAYAFMDGSCYNSIVDRIGDIPFSRQYLPVPIPKPKPTIAPKQIENGKINIGWLGRLDRDKIFSVINTADNLVAMESIYEIDFHIIGDGNSKCLIEPNDYSPQIRFIFTSNLYGEERDRYIRENIDIMVAMGMSATDSAQLKIPVILPIVSPHRYYDNKYIYLYDTKEYAIGWDPDEIGSSGCIIHPLEDIVSDIYVKKLKEEIGNRCFDTSKELFSVENSGKHLMDILQKTELTIEECGQCAPLKKMMKRYRRYSKFANNPDYGNFIEIERLFRIDSVFARGVRASVRDFLRIVANTLRER